MGPNVSPMVDLWLIIYKDTSKLEYLLDSLRATPIPYHISILDNSCDKGIADQITLMLQDDVSETLYISDKNLMCGGGSNFLLGKSTAPIISYLCAHHTEINHPSWITDAVALLDSDPKLGMVGPLVPVPGLFFYKALYGGNRSPHYIFPDHLPMLEDNFTREEIFEKANTQIHIQGGAWVARREALLSCGGFEPALPHYFMDVEIATRIQCHGWTLGNVPSMFSEYWGGRATPNHRDYALCHFYRET